MVRRFFGSTQDARYTPNERKPMSPSIAEANEMLRNAVEARREAQAAGKPLEAWYVSQGETDSFQPVTGPMPCETSAEVSSHATFGYDAETMKAARDWVAARDEFAEFESSNGRPGSLPFLELLEEVRQLHLSKSQDYGSSSDPLANIRQGAEFVGIEPWRGCMVRIADKVQRLRTYCQTGRLVHEGVRDTLLDLSAYSLLAIVLFDEGKQC
jgi:hypothetical protein